MNILLVEDHTLLRESIAAILAEVSFVDKIYQAGSGEEAIGLVRAEPVNTILMDVSMPGMNGIEATRIIKQEYPEMRVLFITSHAKGSILKQAISAGGDGYILKTSGKAKLLEGLQTLVQGDSYFDPDIQKILLQETLNPNYEQALVDSISSREREVLNLLAKGFTTLEIGKRLFISENTVKSHRKNLLAKANANNIAHLISIAGKLGLID